MITEPLASNSRPGAYALLLTVVEPLTLKVGQLGHVRHPSLRSPSQVAAK